MSLDTVLEIVRDRQLRLAFRPDGQLVVRGPRDELTVPLIEALQAYKDELLELLSAQPSSTLLEPTPEIKRCREFLWHPGHRCVQTPDDPRYGTEEFAPVGAWWWRYQGGAEWQAVPGRGGECCSPLFPAPVPTEES